MDLFGHIAPPPATRWPCLPVPGFMPAGMKPPIVVPPPKFGTRRVVNVDSFAGGGGASTGIEEAFRRLAAMGLLPAGHRDTVDYAVNHDEPALAMHFANHRDTIHLPHNVWKVRMQELIGDNYFGLLWLSPDCFPAGTLVLTDRGYRPIETIQVGDVVLTHKLRWRKVVQTHRGVRPLMKIKGRGHHGLLVSPEHPFLIKKRTDVWRNDIRQYRGTYNAADWQPASALGAGSYWGTPTTVPDLPIPEMHRSDFRASVLPIDERLMWLAGRYLGDGWTRISDTRAELVIICGKHEADALSPTLDKWPRTTSRVRNGELAWSRRDTRTAVQFAAQSRGLVTWLRDNFGHGAEHKTMPAWAFGMPVEYREALLAGYLSADGWNGKDWKGNDVAHSSTISRALAYSLKQLASTLGHAVGVHEKHPTNDTIEGRKVDAKSGYDVRWRPSPSPKHARTFVDDDIRWSPIASTEPASGPVPVFNIGVEDDESYVVEGIIVHNCRDHSPAKGGPITSRSVRDLAWVLVKWLKELPPWQRPWSIFLENVPAFAQWSPLVPTADGAGYERDPERKGEIFHRFVKTVCGYGYSAGWHEEKSCRHGDPTIRNRLYLVFRRDGEKVVFPAQTHGDPKSDAVKAGKLLPWPVAADILDFSIDCPSIFLTREEAKEYTKATGKRIVRPLAGKTGARIAKGTKRHVVDAGDDAYVVTCNHAGEGFRGQSIREPLATVARARDAFGLVVPHVAVFRGDQTGKPVTAAVPTVTANSFIKRPGGASPIGLAEATIVPHVMTMRNSGKPTSAADQPTHTVTAGGAHQCEVEATIVPCIVGVGGRMGQSGPRPVTKPWQSATTKPDSALVQATVAAWPGPAPEGEPAELDGDCWDKLPPVWRAVASRPPTFEDWIAVTGAHGGTRAEYDRLAENGDLVMTPFVSRGQHGGGNRAATEPLHTIAASDGDTNQVVVPYLVPRYGEREGQAPRSLPVDRPMPTPVPDGNQGSMTVAYLAQHNGGTRGPIGRDAREPLATVMTDGSQQQLVAVHLSHAFTSNTCGGNGNPRRPLKTILAGGNHASLITLPLISAYYGEGGFCVKGDTPLPTASTRDRFGLIQVGAAPPPLTAAQLRRARQVADFLRFHGCWDGGEFVTVTIRGVLYVIVDIGMRMLTPRELARAQGFPEWYILDPIYKGKPLSETEQRHKIGNSVTRLTAAAHVAANHRPPLEWGREAFLEAAE